MTKEEDLRARFDELSARVDRHEYYNAIRKINYAYG